MNPRPPGITHLAVHAAGLAVLCVATVAVARPAKPDETRRIAISGTSLAYVERGAGDPVVLVHSSLGDYRSWSSVIKPLARGHRVIAYSRRNHHPNPATLRASLDQDVADLDTFVRALQLPPAHLVGHGRGAEVCARYALEHPDRVRSLVLCEPALPGLIAGTAEDSAFRAERREVFARARIALRDGFPDVAVRAVVDWEYGYSPGLDGFTQDALVRAGDNLAAFRLEMDAGSRATEFDCNDAAKLTVPVLFVTGSKSPAMRRSVGEAFARCRPGTRHVTLARAGHDVPEEAAGAFGRAVASFLDQVPAEPAIDLAGDPAR